MQNRPHVLKASFKGSLRENKQTGPKLNFLIGCRSINSKTVCGEWGGAEGAQERGRVSFLGHMRELSVGPTGRRGFREEPSLVWTECPGPPVPVLQSPEAAWLKALHQDEEAWAWAPAASHRTPQRVPGSRTLSGKLGPASCRRAGPAFTDMFLKPRVPEGARCPRVGRAGG